MREVDISVGLLPQHQGVMRCLHLLSKTIETENWCLVGGLMVLVAARSAGRTSSRAEGTKDGDVVVDVVSEPTLLTAVTNTLLSLGYRQPEDHHRGEDFARCTFVSGLSQLDVLAPDDTPTDRLDTENGLRSLAIPGGRRALRAAVMTRIYYSDEGLAEIRVPTLSGAICVKAAAALDRRTERYAHHSQDVAYLLSCIRDPFAMRSELDDEDQELLVELSDKVMAASTVPWRQLERDVARTGRAALQILISG